MAPGRAVGCVQWVAFVTKELSSLGTNRLIHGSRMNAAPVGANYVAGPYSGGLNEENFHFLRKAEAFALAQAARRTFVSWRPAIPA